MSGRSTDAAVEKVLASIGDAAMAARYPDRTHFISADRPDHGLMATKALYDGDPVAIVYPDGHELLVCPEHASGVSAIFLAAAAFFLRRGRRNSADEVQLPPRARVEARDPEGHSIAA